MTGDRNHLDVPGRFTRRALLRRSALVAGMGAAAPWALDLAGIGSATAAAADDGDYRAIVCIFLYGGNDQHNTFVPTDATSRTAYERARGDLAVDRSRVLHLDPHSGFDDGRSIGLAPQLTNTKRLFDSGDAAIVANVGSLVRPTTKSQFESDVSVRPPALFSHNDQQSFWQSSQPDGATTGWGGRLGDLLLDDNGANNTFTCISAAGNAVMLNGRDAIDFHVSSQGAVKLDLPYRPATVGPLTAGLEAIMRRSGSDAFDRSYAQLAGRALDTSGQITEAVEAAPTTQVVFPFSSLGEQLHAVARQMSAGKNVLGLKRQVFFVAAGGFDHHDRLATSHPELLADLDAGIGAFHQATVELGLHDSVTTFTASDFGRTLSSNGDGTDHGWGSHHLVVGGAVNGRRCYGTLPVVASDGPDDVGNGRLIPTIATDQYAATLARWMGAGDDVLDTVIPNIGQFSVRDLGFLTPSPPVSVPVSEPVSSDAPRPTSTGAPRPVTTDAPQTPTRTTMPAAIEDSATGLARAERMSN